MLIKKPRDIEPSEITPKDLYLNRRQFLLSASATAISAGAVLSGLDASVSTQRAMAGEKLGDLRKSSFSTSEKLNSFKDITTYNNFYELGTDKGASDPKYLTEAARGHLRSKFMGAQAGLTGVNFAVAETGGVVVCTNEGNADMGASLPRLHIACMGIEKLIPRAAHLSVFLRLLARSGTGQPITGYTSHFNGPVRGGEMHVVIVDNGRSRILGQEAFRRSLGCIRCGACMNTCPVYRRSGGYSYGYTVPGPIGSILAPQ